MKRGFGLVAIILLVFVAVAAIAQDDTRSSRGSRLFVVQGCYGCHTIGRMGTPIGPDLTRVGVKYSERQLARWLRDPEGERPGAHMPLLELTPSDIDALAAFLAGQHGA
jgi:cytochrome c oxidase subunit 2